jgi:hypothetical protein
MGILAKLTRTVGTTTGAMINLGEKTRIAYRAMVKPGMGAGFTKLAKVEIPAAATAAVRMKTTTLNSMKSVVAGIGGVGKALIQMQAQMRNVKRADYMGTMAKNSDAVKSSIFDATEGMGNFKKRTQIAKAEMKALQEEMQQIAISQANLGKSASFSQLTSGPLGQKYGASALGGRAAIGGKVMRYGGAALGGVTGLASSISDYNSSGGGTGNAVSAVGGGLMAAGGILAMTGVGMPIALGVEAAGMIATAIGGAITAEEDKKKVIEIAKADVRILEKTNAENALTAVMQAANLNLTKGQDVIDKAMGFTSKAVVAAAGNTGVKISKTNAQGILNKVLIDSPEIAAAIAKNPALASGIMQSGAQIAGARGLKFNAADPEGTAANYEAISAQILQSFSKKVDAGVTNPLKAATSGLITQYQGRVIRKDEFGQGMQETLNKSQALGFARESKQGGALQYSTRSDLTDTERDMSLIELQKKYNAESPGESKARLKQIMAEAYAAVKVLSSDKSTTLNPVISTDIKLPVLGNTGTGKTAVGAAFGQGALGNWNNANIFGDRPAGVYSIAKPSNTEVKLAKGDSGKLVDAATGMMNLSKVISGWTTRDGKLITIVDKDANDKVAPQFMVPAGLNKDQKKFLDDLNTQLAKAWAAGG